ncbi:anti-sigma factor family protein [Streptomyces minutiscleroticus]|uniref:anti-sigma factor family protein n=1 Tax=Streptomyces minutiscleroticus TaxID=68238 RepID=UPI003D9F5D08
MTSMTDEAGHPEVSELSDLTEGLLTPSRTADVRQHLNGCDLCADVYASLEEIRGLLGTLPGPVRMPTDVAERIDAALAAEALLDATAPGARNAPAPVTASSTSTASSDEDGRVDVAGVARSAEEEETGVGTDAGTHVSRETSPPSNRLDGHPRAATGPGRPTRTRRVRRRTAALGAALTAAALGLGGLLVQALGGDEPPSTSPKLSTSADDFSGEAVEGRVAELLAQNQSGDSSFGVESAPSTRSTSRSPGTLKQPGVQVPDCVQKGTGRAEVPLAAEEGTYDGTDAYLVVLPDRTDTERVTAYVVDSSCVKQDPSSPGEVLLTRSYALQS